MWPGVMKDAGCTVYRFSNLCMNPTQFARRIPVAVAFSSSLLLAIAGCQPRGESHTLEQILTDARSAYSSVSGASSGDVSAQLDVLKGKLDKLAGINGGGDARELAGDVVSMLSELSRKASYTVRPGLAELTNQYRVLSNEATSAVNIGAPNVKLLVARTYTSLASELKTTKFGL